MDLTNARSIADQIKEEVRKAIVGQDEAIDLMLTCLLAGGHILLEGVPGTAKTLLAQAFAATLGLQFGRIQFTPDLMPGDMLGTNLFNFQTNEFVLTKGPIFTEVLLADEINRTPPKTQSALLEAMNERSVTIDARRYSLGEAFMVIATQNPIEQQGTYPLPEAQLDRFLFKIVIGYPDRDAELEIVRRHGHQSVMPRIADFGLRAVAGNDTLHDMRAAVAGDYTVRRGGRIHCRYCPQHARQRQPGGGCFAARGHHAGGLFTGARVARGPRLCDSRRREIPGPAGAAPPPDGYRARGYRRSHGGPHPGEHAGGHPGAAMIRPTRKAVLLFAGVLPVPWLVLSYRPEWWPWAFEGSLLVLIGLGVDAVLARPRSQIRVR